MRKVRIRKARNKKNVIKSLKKTFQFRHHEKGEKFKPNPHKRERSYQL